MAEPCTRGGYADVCIDSADSGDAGHAADATATRVAPSSTSTL